MKNSECTIELKAVGLFRGQRDILRGIDWQATAGQQWAMLGPNGSGKTTLLKIVTGYLWPSGGEVTVLGHRFGEVDLRELRRHIGWVSSALQMRMPPGLSAIDAVLSGRFGSIGLYDAPTPEQRLQAAELLKQLSGPLAESAWGVLSLGEQQRTLVARALMSQPALMILDEPCAGMDLPGREALLASLERLMSEGTIRMVYVTHHIEEITPRFTHVLVLKEGQVVAAGPKEAVLTDAVLSEAFSLPIEVRYHHERYWPTVKAK